MNIFQEVKARVTARQAAERYGLRVRRNGMACCPFHNDKHPSLKIDQNYYCFACGAKGDAVNYVAVLFGLSQFEAAKKINEDFAMGISIAQPEVKRKQNSGAGKKEKVPTKEERIQFVQKKIDGWAKDAKNVLLRYLRWMEFWKEFYKPESTEEEWHPLFAEALQNESKISYLVDMLMFGTNEEIMDFSRTEGRR
ncbi:MAG: CHC2 zinc finger domain-containing protein [Oliverpabstia sp.]|nr:CHC2 zinc finger domain-containing protein [Lachnospiraceae bacterium]MCI7737948.1 CHC2 zinc finger domain-containing protein [Lachnospiraceae bacterium]MDY5026612.1 CHC2 zinc finger domain-containing protein [Oliverpabstia sp.]